MKREKTKHDPDYITWLNRLAVAAAIAAIAEAIHIMKNGLVCRNSWILAPEHITMRIFQGLRPW